MPRYEKDEINFHGFLKMTREMREVTLEQLCHGLCSVSMMERIEKGDRLPEKIMRDRLLSRLNVSCDGYEDYLPPDEFKDWEMRQKIVSCI